MNLSRLKKYGVYILLVLTFIAGISLWRAHKGEGNMYPGLGIKDLHAQGIDGTGVGVAIIDQKLLVKHIEYSDRLVHYKETRSLDGERNSMHGPAVASILVGKNCGVAPGASLYYWAVPVLVDEPGGRRDARAIRDIIEFNKTLSQDKKLRILSISTGYRDENGGKEFVQAIQEAREAGIIVFTSTFPYFTDPVIAVYNAALEKGGSRDDLNDYAVQPVVVQYTGQTAEAIVQMRNRQSNEDVSYMPVWVPVEPRLLASWRGPKRYEMFSEGGDSWATPFVAGVAALILQVNPQLSNEEVIGIIANTAVENTNGLLMISPKEAIMEAQRVR